MRFVKCLLAFSLVFSAFTVVAHEGGHKGDVVDGGHKVEEVKKEEHKKEEHKKDMKKPAQKK